MKCADLFLDNQYKKNEYHSVHIEKTRFDIHKLTETVNDMPHRLIGFNILDYLLGFVPMGLMGLFDFDPLIIAHMLGCYTGAYVKLLYDLKVKKMERQWAMLYALGSVSLGYVIGNALSSYYKIPYASIQIALFSVSAICANFVAVAIINISKGLEQNSWALTKDYFRKMVKNWLGIK